MNVLCAIPAQRYARLKMKKIMEIFKCNFKGIDLEFELSSGVFKPTATTRVLAANMRVSQGNVFIDMGCGVGYIGILAAKLGAKKVYAVDLEREACELARENARRNRVEKIVEVREGNLFEPLEDIKADVVVDDVSGIAGLIARSSKSYKHERIPIASNDGSWPTTEMLQEVPKYLTKRGKLYFPLLSLANEGKIMESAKKSFKHITNLEVKILPLKGEFGESSIDYLKRLHAEGKIKLIQRGSRLCWQLSIMKASDHKKVNKKIGPSPIFVDGVLNKV